MERRFGRFFAADGRDRSFAPLVRRALTGSKHWRPPRPRQFQGTTQHCVGFAWGNWLLGQPIGQYLDPHGIYFTAQHFDEWDGENYDGTSVRAGAKVLHHLGFIDRYEWAVHVEEIAEAVRYVGPVVIGTNWYRGMDQPDRRGRIHATGRLLGGHAWVLDGVDFEASDFRYGNSHQENPQGRISFADVERLMGEEGEACLAIERQAAPRAA